MVLGQGKGEETQHPAQPGRAHGEVLEEVKKAPEEDDLGEGWSSTVFSSSLTPSTVDYPGERHCCQEWLILLYTSILDSYIVVTSHTQRHSLTLP